MIIETIVTCAGLAMSFGYFPQAFKIWRSKSTQGVSRASVTIFATGNLIWSIYGIIRQDWTIITSFVFGLIGSWLVLILLLTTNPKESTNETAVYQD